MKIQIAKIKFDGERTRIEYAVERKDGRGYDEYSLSSIDLPAAEFVTALNALAADVVGICEFAEDDATKLTVRGVTITHTEGILGAVITALKTLKTAAAPLVINTPHLPETPYGEGAAGSPVLDEETVERLHKLLHAAERYIDGERAAQPSMLVENKEDLLRQASIHESIARIGDPTGDGSTTASFGRSGGEMHTIDPKAHRRKAKELREKARHATV